MSFVNKPITHILCSPQMTWLCPATYQTMRSFSWGRGIISLISTDWWEKRTGQCIYWVSVSLIKEDWLTDRFLSFQWNSFTLVFCFCFDTMSILVWSQKWLDSVPPPHQRAVAPLSVPEAPFHEVSQLTGEGRQGAQRGTCPFPGQRPKLWICHRGAANHF